jgi:lysophospholipase L1-like esterase
MSLVRTVIALLASIALAGSAWAQSPGSFVQGTPLNASDLNSALAGKQDYIGPPAPLRSVPATAKSLCLYGDSISANSDQVTSPNYYAQTSGGYGTWLNLYSVFRVYRAPQTNNFGNSGDTTAQMLARVNAVVNAGCHIVVFQGGMNNIGGGGLTVCTSAIADLKAIFATLMNAGIAIVDTTIFPRTGPALWNQAQISTAICINDWRREFARSNRASGYYLVDLDPVMTDPSAATWAILANYLQASDGIHPSVLGGSAMGYAIAQVINQLVPPWLVPLVSISDTFDAVNNTRGNLLPNGVLAGTGGAIGTCTGTSANSMAVTSSPFTGAAGTCALSMVTLSNNVRAQQIVLGGTLASAQNVDITQSVATPGNIVNGDTVRGLVWVNTSSGLTNIVSLDMFLSLTMDGTVTTHHAFNPGTLALPSAGFAPSFNFGGQNWVPMMTDSFLITGSSITVGLLDLHLGGNAGAIAGTIQTCCWQLRKVQP